MNAPTLPIAYEAPEVVDYGSIADHTYGLIEITPPGLSNGVLR